MFETQEHALDNCAAACAFSAWRCAVNCSHIYSLHLHANGVHSRDWASFLSSRPSLSKLQISRQPELTGPDESWLHHIPLSCRSLVIGDLPEDPHLITDRLINLRELTIGISQLPTAKDRQCMSTLVHLTELNSLHLVGLEHCLDSLPWSLKHSGLDGIDDMPASRAVQQGLLQLTSLELRGLPFSFIEMGLTSLQNVRSLSLQDSTIWSSPTQLMELTLLTYLNLSRSLWMTEEDGVGAYRPFTVFRAWPVLQVLKVDYCNLFNATTSLEAPRDLQVSWVTEKQSKFSSQARWSVMDATTVQSPIPDYCCLKYLVALHIIATYDADAVFYAEAICQALSNCQFLDNLHLGGLGTSCDGAAEVVVKYNQGQSLKKLKLQGVAFSTLDLRCATRLTCLDLWEPPEHVCVQSEWVLHLPANLEICTLVGNAILTSAARLVFEPCRYLTKLCLGIIYRPGAELPLTLPVLPSSLRQLAIRSSVSRVTLLSMRHDSWILECDWHCLDTCINLQHLSLPSTRYLKGYLKSWVESTRCLHILKFENKLRYHSYEDQL